MTTPSAGTQRVMALSAFAAFGLLAVGLIVPGWLPFPSPDDSAAQVGQYYQEHRNTIRLASILIAAGAALLAPLAAVLTIQMKRIEGDTSPLAYLQLGMGSVSALAITIPTFFWQAAAFDPGRDPEITKFAHDAGWLCITATIFFVQLQLGALAVAIFKDRGEQPVFPRWIGYASAWVVIALFPSLLCLWFKTGPFAWSGIFSLYLAFAAVGTYLTALVLTLLKIIGGSASPPSA